MRLTRAARHAITKMTDNFGPLWLVLKGLRLSDLDLVFAERVSHEDAQRITKALRLDHAAHDEDADTAD